MKVVIGILIWMFGSMTGIFLMCLVSATSKADGMTYETENENKQKEYEIEQE